MEYWNKIMKWIVKLWVAGKIFTDEVIATNPKQAIETSKNRNPYARVISVNISFR
jgi:hypothetical protein